MEKFLNAQAELKQGNPELMKAWVNTELGETWEEPGARLDDNELFNRREIYEAEVPDGVIVLTAGVDVQADRFEVKVVGWEAGKENWGICYRKIFGDVLKEQVWEDLDRFLLSPFHKEDGSLLHICCTCIDSGYQANAVYTFAKERISRRVFAIKGRGGANLPYIRNPTESNREKTPLFTIGVDAGKTLLFKRLQVQNKGPNYCHFPLNEAAGYNEDYFRGLTAEQQVTRFHRGRLVMAWIPREGNQFKRNEPLDLRNYASAAMEILGADVLKITESDPPSPHRTGRRIRFNGIR